MPGKGRLFLAGNVDSDSSLQGILWRNAVMFQGLFVGGPQQVPALTLTAAPSVGPCLVSGLCAKPGSGSKSESGVKLGKTPPLNVIPSTPNSRHLPARFGARSDQSDQPAAVRATHDSSLFVQTLCPLLLAVDGYRRHEKKISHAGRVHHTGPLRASESPELRPAMVPRQGPVLASPAARQQDRPASPFCPGLLRPR